MTAWVTPAAAASRKKSSKNMVRTAMLSVIRCMPTSGVAAEVVGVEVAAGEPGEDVDADRADQRFGERIVDQRVLRTAGQRAGRGDHRRRRADARGEIPGVVVGACHGGASQID